MKLFTLSHQKSAWNQPWLPSLDSEQTLVLAFGTAHLKDEGTALEELRRAYPRAMIAGCSTSGEIHGSAVQDDSFVVAVARFEKTRLAEAHTKVSHFDESHAAGMEIAKKLCASEDPRGVLVFADGLHVNGSDFVRGLSDSLPHSVVVAGGLAGDSDRFHSTWVMVNRHAKEKCISAIGLYGDAIRVHSGSAKSPSRFAPAPGSSDRGPILSAAPTASALRDLPRSDAAGGATTATTPLRSRAERMVDGAEGAARITAIAEPYVGDVLSLAISGVGRRITLGERAASEMAAALAVLPQGTQQIGFYSYGAFFAKPTGGGLDLHHSTVTITTLGET